MNFNNVTKRFDGTVALDRVSFDASRGEIVGLIGPNGSGKTTAVNIISAFYRPDEGDVFLDERKVTGMSPFRLRRIGVSRTFQNLRLFEKLTVMDNVLIGAHPQFVGRPGLLWGWPAALLGAPGIRKVERFARNKCMESLEEVGMLELHNVKVADLPYGLKKRLELARATVIRPKLLLLDEPTAGLSAIEAETMLHLVQRQAVEFDASVVVIEHRLDWLLDIANRIVVLAAGTKIAEGRPADIVANQEVMKAYVGA